MSNPFKTDPYLKRPLAGKPYVCDCMLADYRRAVNFVAKYPRGDIAACEERGDNDGARRTADQMDCCIDLLVIVFGVPKVRVREDVDSMYFAQLEAAEREATEREDQE